MLRFPWFPPLCQKKYIYDITYVLIGWKKWTIPVIQNYCQWRCNTFMKVQLLLWLIAFGPQEILCVLLAQASLSFICQISGLVVEHVWLNLGLLGSTASKVLLRFIAIMTVHSPLCWLLSVIVRCWQLLGIITVVFMLSVHMFGLIPILHKRRGTQSTPVSDTHVAVYFLKNIYCRLILFFDSLY